jgi:hypothetical protein
MALYCDTPFPEFAEDICANEEGRIIGVAFMRSDHTVTDPTSLTQWQNAIAAGEVVVIKNVRGAKPKSTPVQIDGYGRQKTKNVGREFTATYSHPDVIGNEGFYNVANYDGSHSFWYYTQGNKIWSTGDAIANIDADTVVEEGLDTAIAWDVAISWADQDIPEAYDAPAGIFE